MKKISFRTDVLPLKNELFRVALRITLNREDAEDVLSAETWRSTRQNEPATKTHRSTTKGTTHPTTHTAPILRNRLYSATKWNV